LVRYKIPAIPFFLISLIIIWSTYKQLKEEDKQRLLEKEDLIYSP
jgi:choline-glycine betaine transporter